MRDSLKEVAHANGGEGKLILADLCVGKGEMQQVKDKFPGADLVTTHNSSYFIPGSAAREAESEGINAILTTFEGIANRAPTAKCGGCSPQQPLGWDTRQQWGGQQLYLPGDEIVRRRALDRDHTAEPTSSTASWTLTASLPRPTQRDFEAIKVAQLQRSMEPKRTSLR